EDEEELRTEGRGSVHDSKTSWRMVHTGVRRTTSRSAGTSRDAGKETTGELYARALRRTRAFQGSRESGPQGLAVDGEHAPFGIPGARGHPRRPDLVDPTRVLGRDP